MGMGRRFILSAFVSFLLMACSRFSATEFPEVPYELFPFTQESLLGSNNYNQLEDGSVLVRQGVPYVEYSGLHEYTTWGGGPSGPYSGLFHTWETEGVIIYSVQPLTDKEVQVGASYLNTCLNLYRTIGQKPNYPEWDDPNGFGHKATVALVPDGSTCGAGCGAGGRAEFTISTAYSLWGGLSDTYGWAIACYEIGRGGTKFPMHNSFDMVEHNMSTTIPGLIYNYAFLLHRLNDQLVYQKKNRNISPYWFREKFQRQGLNFEQSLDKAIEPEGSLPAGSKQIIKWESDLTDNTWFIYFFSDAGWESIGAAPGAARSFEIEVPNKPGTEFGVMLGNFSFNSGEWLVSRGKRFKIVAANQPPQYADSLNDFMVQDVEQGELLQALFFYMTKKFGHSYMEKFFAETSSYLGPPATGHEVACNIMRAVDNTGNRSDVLEYLISEWKVPEDCRPVHSGTVN